MARAGTAPPRLPLFLAGLGVLLAAAWFPRHLLGIIVFASLALFLVAIFRRGLPSEIPASSAASVFGLLYVALPFAFAVDLRAAPDGRWILLYGLILVWVGDSAAYFGGRAFGKRKLAPNLSPGKTVEGAIASLFVGVAVGHFLYAQWFGETVHSLLVPVVVNLAAQLGDLAESALKRGAGVKDSSNLIPGHGGVLDRVDALLFALPALWYYWKLVLGGGL
jgi:phosphatidate cytidylyltransferase